MKVRGLLVKVEAVHLSDGHHRAVQGIDNFIKLNVEIVYEHGLGSDGTAPTVGTRRLDDGVDRRVELEGQVAVEAGVKGEGHHAAVIL